MGMNSDVICNDCGNKFDVNEGDGMYFRLLHCNKCGKDKQVGFEELTKISRDLSDRKHRIAVEELAGKCDCGGKFKVNAKPRCPKCLSKNYRWDPDGKSASYD